VPEDALLTEAEIASVGSAIFLRGWLYGHRDTFRPLRYLYL